MHVPVEMQIFLFRLGNVFDKNLGDILSKKNETYNQLINDQTKETFLMFARAVISIQVFIYQK